MQAFKGYEAKKPASREKLPAGGYIARILKAEETQYSWGNVLIISFDISEGEHKDFFALDYRSQEAEDRKWRGTFRLNTPKDDGTEKDGWTKKKFGGTMWAIEASNPGYHWDWDESKLKGRTVGVLFRDKEWQFSGLTGWTTECCAMCEVDAIRNNTFKMPKPKPLASANASAPDGSAFTPVDEAPEDLPF